MQKIGNLSAVLIVNPDKRGVVDFTGSPMVIEDRIPQTTEEARENIKQSIVSREYKWYPPGRMPVNITG
ncbi:MAG: hypothetical protein JXR32_08420 [Anaerolineaceae bacterium]|nr:hypothetical protein [Anaerolineaceae bacterium]